jgi:hypothetical protein
VRAREGQALQTQEDQQLQAEEHWQVGVHKDDDDRVRLEVEWEILQKEEGEAKFVQDEESYEECEFLPLTIFECLIPEILF